MAYLVRGRLSHHYSFHKCEELEEKLSKDVKEEFSREGCVQALFHAYCWKSDFDGALVKKKKKRAEKEKEKG